VSDRGNKAPFSLEGKVILITGAGGGIGAETARVCARLEASLVLVDLHEPIALADALRSEGAEVRTGAFDVRDRAAMERFVGSVGTLDAVVANAGFCPWDDWNDDDWDRVFDDVIDINVKAVINLVRACLPGMGERGRGRVVIVSSVAGRMGGLKASPHYVASKGGVGALVKWLARKAAPLGITVNAVAPGPTKSGMTEGQSFDTSGIPLGRMATPAEIALPIAFLCSEGASYICGATLDVNGGLYMN
jgi:NAD(P)-dependent dehydrogenase (short-subunit alcohol dehydrogenase family)